MFKKNLKKYNLEEFDDINEEINYSLFEEKNESNKINKNNILTDKDYIDYLDRMEDFEDNDYNLIDFEDVDYEIYDNYDYIEILDGTPYDENIDDFDENNSKKYKVETDINVVPEIKIEVIKDNNQDKLVKFSLNVILDNKKEENIVIDLNISQKTYLMIAEELFN